MEETQDIIDKKSHNPVGTEEENCSIIGALSPLVSGSAREKLNALVKNLLTLARKKPKKGLELGEAGAQFFLECLLVLLVLAGCLRFCLLFGPLA